MRFILTGATGMIGLALTNYLISINQEVIMIVRKNSTKISKIPKSNLVTIIECNLEDLINLDWSNNCDYFIHLGWDKTIGPDRSNVDIQYKNIGYTLDAVKIAHKLHVKKFIGVGSQAEYGIHNEPLGINTICNPITPYGIAKFVAGKLSNILCQQYSMQFNWIRILSVYGENDSPHTLMSYINDCIEKGIDANVTKCEQIWDYINCNDAAKIIYRIAINGDNGAYYPLGSGTGKKLKNYIDELVSNRNSKIKINYGAIDYPPNQVMYLVADMSYLKKIKGVDIKNDN